MKKIERWIIYPLLIAVTIISLIALCQEHPRVAGLDYLGVIIGILALLATVLIGWNIYALVDIRDIRKNLTEISTGTSLAMEKYVCVSEGVNLMIYHYLLLNRDPLGLEYRLVYHGVSCLMHASRAKDILTCNAVVKALLECIVNPQNMVFTENGKREILKIIALVNNEEEIEGFLELVNRVALIPVKKGVL